MTAATVADNKFQVTVYSKDQAMAYFKDIKAQCQDLRISAFGINQKNPDILFIDLDRQDFKSERALKQTLTYTLKNIKTKLNGHPSVIMSGRGYHIILPIKCDIPLEQVKELAALEPETSKEFLQWSERYLSNNKACDGHHTSLKSCLLRPPGSINSKNGAEVKIIQEWDGYRPDIKLLIGSFHADLVGRKKKPPSLSINNTNGKLGKPEPYIDKLLTTPIDDYRKKAIDVIIIPYLMVNKGMMTATDRNQIEDIAMEWLDKCAEVRRLEPSRHAFVYRVRRRINEIAHTDPRKRIHAMAFGTLKENNPELWKKLAKS